MTSVPEEEADGEQTMRGVVGGTQLFNRFTLQKVLGRGGMGVVWLARDDRLDRLVALKLVPEAVSFDPSAQEDLKRETRKSLMLTHPNIVRIFDFIEDGTTAAISMEYVDGATLSHLRVQKPARCFEVAELSPWVASLCDALGYAHESARVIHRDLKPANLMVSSRSELKVTDFGIACTLRDSMSYVSVRSSSGTLNYMSPQQMLGQDPSPSDDIYAMGATLYEMLSSKPPFHGGDVASQVREVIAPTIAQRRAKFEISGAPIPKHWEETLASCLAKNPAHRPPTPADVARRLRLTGGPVRLTTPEKASRWKLPMDRRVAAAAGGVVAVLALVLVVRHPQPKPPKGETAGMAPPVHGYAIESPRRGQVLVTTAQERATTSSVATGPRSPLVPAVSSSSAAPPVSQNAKLQLTTTPAGANFAIYPGVVASKTAPSIAPLHTGAAPESVDDLPPGRYTVFFHSEGWPDDREEISLEAGETLPVAYTFPHGSAVITSSPDGAEIFAGARSLGHTPLTVDLPIGKQQLTARSSDLADRTETVTIGNAASVEVAFQFRARTRSSSRKPKPTPTPTSALSKIGNSLKKVFSPKTPTPPPKRKK